MTLTPVNVSTRRPRVTRRWLFVVAATLAVVLCAGYLWTYFGYRLDHGSQSWHGADAESRTEGSMTELRYAFNPGAQVTFGVSIRNPGPWPITIIGITAGDFPADDPVLKTARVTVNHADKSTTAVFDPAAAAPLRSARVGAGMELPVFVTITIPDVQTTAGGGIFFEDVAVDYWLLGLAHHQRVPMGFRLELYSTNAYIPR